MNSRRSTHELARTVSFEFTACLLLETKLVQVENVRLTGRGRSLFPQMSAKRQRALIAGARLHTSPSIFSTPTWCWWVDDDERDGRATALRMIMIARPGVAPSRPADGKRGAVPDGPLVPGGEIQPLAHAQEPVMHGRKRAARARHRLRQSRPPARRTGPWSRCGGLPGAGRCSARSLSRTHDAIRVTSGGQLGPVVSALKPMAISTQCKRCSGSTLRGGS